MRTLLLKTFMPWKAAGLFAHEEQFHAFLLRCNKRLNTVRVILFALAAVCLMLSYALELPLYNYIAVGALCVALVLTLMHGENEKKLPEHLRQS